MKLGHGPLGTGLATAVHIIGWGKEDGSGESDNVEALRLRKDG